MKLLIRRLLSYFPTQLPVGLTEFDAWADDIIELAGAFADRDSMRFVLANQVMHMPPYKSSVPKNQFVRGLRKTACNQIAGQVFQQVKEAQEARRRAEDEAKKLAEATASTLEPVANETTEKQA